MPSVQGADYVGPQIGAEKLVNTQSIPGEYIVRLVCNMSLIIARRHVVRTISAIGNYVPRKTCESKSAAN